MKLRRCAGMLVALSVLAGCGGDDGSDRPDAREDEAAVRKVLTEALDALYEGDGRRACALYTSSFRRELVRENQAKKSDVAPRGATCEEQVKAFEPILKRFVPNRTVKIIRVTVSGDEATAVSEFTTARGKSRVTEYLVRQDGAWKINHDEESS